MLLYFPLNSLPFLNIFAEGHTELQAASGASLEVSTMAEDMTIKPKTIRLHAFTAASPARTRAGTASRAALPGLPPAVRRQRPRKTSMSTCANGTGMCTSPSAPHPGGQPGTAARQKACFLGRSELAPPTSPLSSILLPGW